MTLSAILLIIILGVILILIEFLILPGTNIAGIIGLLFIIGGIYFAYKDIGVPIAHYVLFGSLLFMITSIFFALRSNTWKNMSLKTSIDSKVENIKKDTIKIGDEGVTVTRLAPIGKARIGDQVIEAKSNHLFLDAGTLVVILKINGNQIEVKPIESKEQAIN